jgi:hypothetical protein
MKIVPLLPLDFRLIARLYNAHGHKLRLPPSKKAQFVTALGIIPKKWGNAWR